MVVLVNVASTRREVTSGFRGWRCALSDCSHDTSGASEGFATRPCDSIFFIILRFLLSSSSLSFSTAEQIRKHNGKRRNSRWIRRGFSLQPASVKHHLFRNGQEVWVFISSMMQPAAPPIPRACAASCAGVGGASCAATSVVRRAVQTAVQPVAQSLSTQGGRN